MDTSLNPYSPPSHLAGQRDRPQMRADMPISALCIRSGWVSRTIALSGGVTAEIRYQGWGKGEKIFVNDVHVATSSFFYLSVVAPRIDFEIDCGDMLFGATVEVRASILQLLRVTRFSLFVNGELVYAD